MSWEHSNYIVTCKPCGHTGSLKVSSDDWNRTEVGYEGFKVIRMSALNPTGAWIECEKCGNSERSEIETVFASSS